MLANFWSRVNKTSSWASEIPAMSKSFSLIIFPVLFNVSKSSAAFRADALSKEQTVMLDKNFSATCLFSSVLCLSNSYSDMVVVLISSFSVSSFINVPLFRIKDYDSHRPSPLAKIYAIMFKEHTPRNVLY